MAARRVERTVTTTTTPGARQTRATSRTVVEGGEEAVVVVKQGMGLGDAMGIVTFLLLVAAIILVDYMLGKQYGSGLFFKP